MRHNRDEKRFDRTASHMRAMLSNMTNDLVLAGRIKTTTQRAKVLRRFAERMITLGKDGTLAARRRAMAFMRNKMAVTKLFDDIAPKFKERNGGYTRILKIGERPGDNASMSFIELVESGAAPEAAAPKTAKKAPLKKTAKPAAKKAESAPKKAASRKKAAEGEEKKAPKPRKKKETKSEKE